ncbi:ankyrin repeat domain-containing protein [Actinoplanes sp. NBRC 101535]|uniref:ankyrin repeat domain-containing protein n=1 Tax=Actinoplanes sp. NBRC 101535 TaxID=3032196 RepID=UPI0024A42680|nr:ankyrin repeat domain-containing protein [Actinoplanes sp. NBRC 101535]GLY08477.1 serine/threonine protein kinase [Actinoplanes sp. NBRC 101535]
MNRRRRKKLQRLLVETAGWGSAKRIGELLRAGADPDLPDLDGTTPLYRASVQDRAENVRVLAAGGADPNRESGSGDEGLPLCGAACWGHDATVRALLAAGADPLRREDGGRGRTAREWAEVGGHHIALAAMDDAGR